MCCACLDYREAEPGRALWNTLTRRLGQLWELVAKIAAMTESDRAWNTLLVGAPLEFHGETRSRFESNVAVSPRWRSTKSRHRESSSQWRRAAALHSHFSVTTARHAVARLQLNGDYGTYVGFKSALAGGVSLLVRISTSQQPVHRGETLQSSTCDYETCRSKLVLKEAPRHKS